MNVQLLLLLALAGPFCAFTHASPTALPDDLTIAATEKPDDVAGTEASQTVVTGPPATVPEVAPAEVTTDGAPEPAGTSEVVVITDAPAIATEAATVAAVATVAPEPAITDAPAVETVAPTVAADAEVQTEAPAPEATEAGELVIEDPPAEDTGMSSGQVVGIVIGALLAVVIATAVVIAVVRRMGKYSSPKNKKPAKKDGVVSPLRKKPGKQQERKFWKF